MSLVVGIDIGNENCVVSAINKNGVADVVLNEASNRETPLLIHFDKKQRFFGSAGVSYASRNPKATFTQIKRLIGRRFDEPSFQKERHLLPYDTFEGPNSEIIVRVEFAGKPWEFTAVELLGMFLCHLSKSVKKLTDSQISECVLGVPSYLTIQQRKDYLLAAEIAGLKPRRLFHDGAATALEYALSRDFPYGEAINVVFIDIGHCDTQVTVVKFCFGTLTVLAHSFDRDLGGRNFDDKIFDHLVGVIQDKHSINVSDHVKASFRLRTACGKAKTVLSVNTEASVSIECLVNDIDVEETITRANFENMSTDLLNGVVNACKKALEDAGLGTKEIRSIELVGSGSRIPMISQILEKFFGQKMSRTVNGSECIANGCTLQCAMLCSMPPITRTFGVLDTFPFSLGYRSNKNPSVIPSKIFDKGRFFLDIESLTLPLSFINVILEYADSMELPCDASKGITHYKICYDEHQEGYLEVRFQINIHGILHILSASMVNKLLNEHESSVNSVNMESYNDGEGTEGAKEEGSSPTLMTNDLLVEVVAVQGHSTGMQVGKFLEVLSHTGCGVVERAHGKENELVFQDKANENAKNQRNKLEAYLIHLRTEVLGKSYRFASKEHRSFMLTMLQDNDAWLYGPGADETEHAYIEKQQMLRLASKDLYDNHRMGQHHAGLKKRDLGIYAQSVWQLYKGRLHSLKEEEKNALISKLSAIDSMMNEHDLRFQEEYINEIEELKLIDGTISERLKVEETERSKSTGLLDAGKQFVTRLFQGSNQAHSDINNQAGVDSMFAPAAANPTDRVPNRDDEVISAPVHKFSVPNETDETELKKEPQPLNSEALTSYPDVIDEHRILYQQWSETALESKLLKSSQPMNEQKNSNDANMVTQQSIRPIGDENTYNNEIVNSNKGDTLENVPVSSEQKITQGSYNVSTTQTGRSLHQPRPETALESKVVESRQEQKNNHANMVTQQSIRPLSDQITYNYECVNSNKGHTSEGVQTSSERKITQGAYTVSTNQTRGRETKGSTSKTRKKFDVTLVGTSRMGNIRVTCYEDMSIADLKNLVYESKQIKPINIMNHSCVSYPDDATLKSIGFKKRTLLYYEFASV